MAGQDNNKINEDGAPDQDNETAEQLQNPEQEYDFLDSKLDELNSALDLLEQKNDNIHEKLKELLQSSRTIREEMQQNNASNAENKS